MWPFCNIEGFEAFFFDYCRFFLEKYRDFLKISDESKIYVKQGWPTQVGLGATFEFFPKY
jgi:hypothetical protein